MPYWLNCEIASRDKSAARTTPRLLLPRALVSRALMPLVVATLALAASLAARADAQRDPELRAIVSAAISAADCFPDKFESAVWYTLMEPKLHTLVPDPGERMQILKTAFCEAHRPGEQRLPPGLIMAVIDVESRFDRWAVSSAGAVGLMQVMPFWPEKLGLQRYELVHVAPNIRMGCAILRFYLTYEHNDVRRALARYNGSVGRRDYPDLVLGHWTRWGGADDLGFPKITAPR
jgi:soluble lytic murein transglycosylase-like protein